MQIERGAVNTIPVMARVTLSPSYWLLWFRDPERNASVYCIADATNTTGGMVTLRFTETNTPTALDGEVTLSPAGNWELKVYEQTSATNLSPALAQRVVTTIGLFVYGGDVADTGWSGATADCPPGGDCDPTTVNGTESDTPTILVQQGGVNVGTLNPATGVHTVPECDPCEPCDPLTVTLGGVEIVNEADPCGAEVVLECTDLVDALWVEGAGDPGSDGLYTLTFRGFEVIWTNAQNHFIQYEVGDPPEAGSNPKIFDENIEPHYVCDGFAVDQSASGLNGLIWSTDGGPSPAPTVRQATIGDICGGGGDCPACDDVTIQLVDSAANNIGSPDVYAAGTTTTKTAPDGSFQVKDSAGTNIGSPVAVRSNQTGVTATAPDATVQLKDSAAVDIGSPVAYKSNSSNNLTAPDATVTFGGLPFLSVPSDGTVDIDCNTLLDAAYAVDGGSVTGTYTLSGTANGRNVYTLDVNHSFQYSGTRWELIKTGADYLAAVGAETYPWQADWSATAVTVTQSTIGGVCEDCPACPPQLFDIQVSFNGVNEPLITNVDPTVNNTLNINIS
jgi:hypothetical protein